MYQTVFSENKRRYLVPTAIRRRVTPTVIIDAEEEEIDTAKARAAKPSNSNCNRQDHHL